MSDLTEQETYALFANVPYLINEGVPLNVIEEELDSYGLDYKIDPEFSDRLSATLVSDKDLVHSVRGTDIHSVKDLLSDAGLVGSHPLTAKLLNTGVAMFYPYLFSHINPENYNSQFIREQLHYLASEAGYEGMTAWDDGPQMSQAEYIEELQRTANFANKLNLKEYNQKLKTLSKGGVGLLSFGAGANLFKQLVTDNVRIDPELEKLNNIKMKYPNKSISLTGHSLGSLVNVLGRKEKLKSITFNPAPQTEKENPHPSSKIYRIKGDPISYFLTDIDAEPRVELDGKYRNLHSLNNFLPDKIIKKTENLSERRENVINNFKMSKENNNDYNVYFNYCRRFPDNPVCKDKEKNIYLV
jgi:hypothetical protein